MSDDSQDEKMRIFGYSPDDEKLFMYHFTEEGLQETATLFKRDIWFTLTDEEVYEFVGEVEESNSNLKEDFIWFEPKVNGLHIVQCTCGGFLESDKSLDRLAKKAVRHIRRTGHALNPRGN